MMFVWLGVALFLILLLGVLNKKSDLSSTLLALLAILVVGTQALFFNWDRFDFFFYFGQSLLVIYAMISYTQGAGQRYFGALLISVLAFLFLAKNSLGLEYEQGLHLVVWVSLIYALVPVLLYRPKLNLERGLEKTMVIHQFFLQAQFLIWCYQNSVNIKHYSLFEHFVVFVGVLALLVLSVGFFLRKRILWSHLILTLNTFLLMVCALKATPEGTAVLGIWAFSLMFLRLLPKSYKREDMVVTDILNRLDMGAFGGAVFWVQIYMVMIFMDSSVVGSLFWSLLVITIGAWVWALSLTRAPQDHDGLTSKAQQWYLGVWVATQVAIPIVIYWLPQGMGVKL